jgi:hypothetical protein
LAADGFGRKKGIHSRMLYQEFDGSLQDLERELEDRIILMISSLIVNLL